MFDPRVQLRTAPQDKHLTPDQQKVMAAAREFEAVMIHQLLKTMRSTVPASGLESGAAMGTYRDMMDDELSKVMAHGTGLGFADAIARQLLDIQPAKPSTPPTKPSSPSDKPSAG